MYPYFCIIVPVYNVAPYLEECLDSVLNQTFTDWECLCVDDGSQDTSGDILDAYVRKDARIKVTHQPNGGVSSARNRALERAQGKWIAFLDGDDTILSSTFSIFSEVLSDYPNTESLVSNVGKAETRGCLNHLSVRSYESLRLFARGACWALYRRDLIANLRFPALQFGEDSLFSLTYYYQIKQWTTIEFKSYTYRKRENSAMQTVCSDDFLTDWLCAIKARTRLLLQHLHSEGDLGEREYIQRTQDYIFYSHQLGVFNRPFCRTRPFLKLWLEVLRYAHQISPFKGYKRIVFNVLAFTESAWLAKLLIYWPCVAYPFLRNYRTRLAKPFIHFLEKEAR